MQSTGLFVRTQTNELLSIFDYCAALIITRHCEGRSNLTRQVGNFHVEYLSCGVASSLAMTRAEKMTLLVYFKEHDLRFHKRGIDGGYRKTWDGAGYGPLDNASYGSKFEIVLTLFCQQPPLNGVALMNTYKNKQ